MKITLDVFKAICTLYGFHPCILGLIAGLGYKTAPEDEHFISCHSVLWPHEDNGTRTRAAFAGTFEALHALATSHRLICVTRYML
jgi:hypothetical protein